MILKLYNPILTEEGKSIMQWSGSDGVCFKDIDSFLEAIPDDDDTIDLRLHCEGGDVLEGWAIVDKLRASGKTITATVEGICASMATVILLAASKRKAYQHASLLIHAPFIPAWGLPCKDFRADDFDAYAESLRDSTNRMLDFYVERTGADRAELEALMAEDKFIDMERAKALGFIHDILPAQSAAAHRTIINQFNNDMEIKNKKTIASLLNKLGEALGLTDATPTTVAYELTTAAGDVITIDKPEGEDPVVGDAAAPDGEHTMPDGKVIVVSEGVITEIREAEEPEEAEEPADELAEAQARIAELESQLAEANAKAKTKEEAHILNLVTIAGGLKWLEGAKSNYKPEARSSMKTKTAPQKTRLQQRLEEYNK